ncbi:hypothetical protein Mapa_003810 [Marchantia paleacea]|nr:hypothetical protein Mapa_003810 [Marchantia paleacea]
MRAEDGREAGITGVQNQTYSWSASRNLSCSCSVQLSRDLVIVYGLRTFLEPSSEPCGPMPESAGEPAAMAPNISTLKYLTATSEPSASTLCRHPWCECTQFYKPPRPLFPTCRFYRLLCKFRSTLLSNPHCIRTQTGLSSPRPNPQKTTPQDKIQPSNQPRAIVTFQLYIQSREWHSIPTSRPPENC